MATSLDILVVEDHDLLRQAIVSMLCENGHRAEGVYCAEDVDASLAVKVPDIYIVDLNLPGEDGISLSHRLRANQPRAGIVIVSARSDLVDRLAGYKTGADFYLTKPFETDELLAIIQSIGARIKQGLSDLAMVLDVDRLAFKGPTTEIFLTQAEVDLLKGMVFADDQVLSHAEVAAHLKLHNGPLFRATINVRLSQLRKKLASSGTEEPTIRSIRGMGYKLCMPLVVHNRFSGASSRGA